MYTQYLKPALRKIWGSKLYSLISILSLAVGMTTCMLIMGFIRYELGFDQMHHDSESIYRLNWGSEDSGSRFATFYNPVAPLLAEGMPEIEAFARLGSTQQLFNAGEISHRLSLTLVDADFFTLFNYPALQGNADMVIRDEGAVVLTAAAAERLFSRTDVVGETLTVSGMHEFRVGAVVANNPADSHLGFNIFVNIENLPVLWNDPNFWTAGGYTGSDVLYSYVRLAPGSDPLELETAMENFIAANLVPGYGDDVYLQPLSDIHFNPDLQNELSMVDDMLGTVKPLRSSTDILLFSTIAVLTLVIAVLNFMNMQTVRFTRQIREVGVRRIVGSSYPALTMQFVTEGALVSLFALLCAEPLYELLAPGFYSLLGIAPDEIDFLTLPMAFGLMLAAVLLGMLVALYPAFTAARIAPAVALRGEIRRGRSAAAFRSILIIIQFTITIGLIVGSYTVKSQIDYALSRDRGFDPANVIRIELPDGANSANFQALMKTELLTLAEVESVAAGTSIPTRSLSDGIGLLREGASADDIFPVRQVLVSDDYFAALGMTMAAGRALNEAFDSKPRLSAEQPLVSGGLVLNETAARQAGWSDPAEAVGKHLYQGVSINGAMGVNDYTIVGIVRDAHFGSVRRVVEPTAFMMSPLFSPDVMVVRLAGEDSATTLAVIQALWRQQMPEQPLRLSFLADDHLALYAGEERTFALFIALTSLAVMIACSGLYGLACYIAERRTKEIGVRKVMGGSVWSIVLLLTNDFSRLVLLSNLIAWPLAYFVMNRWLENFAYRVDLTPLVFVGSGLIALCIAWVTVGGTAARAASQKPVLALRYE